MNIQRLDHFTIRTERWAETARFFVDVIGMTEGPRPAFRFPGHWLYAGGQPILHIVAFTELREELQAYLGVKTPQPGSGSIDHVSLRCTHLAATQRHFVALGIDFQERVIPQVGEHQLFLQDPNGITVEMIFPYAAHNRIVGHAMPELAVDEQEPAHD